MSDFGNWITQHSWKPVFDAALVSEKFNIFTIILFSAVEKFLPFRKIRLCSADKLWITPKLKNLIAKRQKSLHTDGKVSKAHKDIRNAVQVECSLAKKLYYKNKVAALKSTNVKRWLSEIKKIKDGNKSAPWHIQMLSEEIPSLDHLAERFNQYIGILTEDCTPLEPPESSIFYETPEHLLIDDRIAYIALRQVKVNKLPGPAPIPNRICI